MVELLKKLLCPVLLSAVLPALAAISPDKSYYKVSNHEPGVNHPVSVTVYLRDDDGKAVDAKEIRFNCENAAVSAVTKKAAGSYQGELTFSEAGKEATLTVIADGVKIKENLIQNPDDLRFCTAWTSNLYSNEMRRFADRLEIVSLDKKSNASWSFGTLEKENYLHDRKYNISVDAELKDINGHGIVVVAGERNSAGKEQQSPHYGTFIAGNRSVKLEKLIPPRPWGVKLSFGCSVMTADGMAVIRNPRIEVIPTFISKNTAGREIKLTPLKGYDRFAKSYSKAAQAGFEKLLAMPENKDLKKKIQGNINAYTALAVRKELAKRQETIEKNGADALRKQLREKAFKVEIKAPYGKDINAAAMQKLHRKPVIDGSLNEWKNFSSGFTAWRPAKAKAKLKTEVAIGYDEQNLYLAFRMTGKPERAGKPVPHDDDDIWRCDSIEVFIVPEHGNGYNQLALGPCGQSYDGAEGDKMENFPWTRAAKMTSTGWNAEFAIPWKSVGFTAVPDEFRANFCRNSSESSCWSLHTRGYSEMASMGFVVKDNFGKAQNAASFIAMKNKADMDRQRKEAADSEKARKKLSGSGVIFSLWDEETDFEKNPNFQVNFLAKRIGKTENVTLKFKQAINEFAHESFIVSSISGVKNMEFICSDLVSADGKKIPGANVSVWHIGFLEPDAKYWPAAADKWSKRPLPELVEEVTSSMSLDEFQSMQFRLQIDSRNAIPGKYRGSVTVKCDGKDFLLPVECEVMDFALASCDNNPVWVYIFSSLPYGGKSGEAWAKLYKEHYVTDISFEHPRMLLDGKLIQCPSWRSENYINVITSWKQPENSKFEIDGKYLDFDNRIATCAKWGLRPQLTNRTGSIYPALMPQLDAHMKSLGIKPGQWDYKLGDEDHGPWLVPLAEKIRSEVPDICTSFIPAGYEYWDLKSCYPAFSHLTFSRAAMTINDQGEKDLKHLQSQGMKIARYTNRTSWTERSGRFSGRLDIWEVIIQEGLDGFCVWTAAPYATLNYGLGYGSAYKVPCHDYEPENQTTTQLIYIRKQGDFYKPISCIRLEDMRDGITDALYFKEALKRTANHPAKRQELLKIANSRPKTKADYDRARAKIAEIILALPAK